MSITGTGHTWKLVLPLLANCRHHHCLVAPRLAFGIGKSSFTGRIKIVFHRPLSVISREHSRKISMSASNKSLLNHHSLLFPSSCRRLSPLYMTSVLFWQSAERQSSTDSMKDDDKFTISMVMSTLKDLKDAPLPPLVIGLSGVIPFVSLPLFMFMSDVYIHEMALAQASYGALILSFLGGVRWGCAVSGNGVVQPDWNNLVQAVLPSLVAWSALLLPCPGSTMVLAGSFAGLAYYDMSFPGYAPWFKALRLLLSGIAVLALCGDMLCYLTLSVKAGSK